MRGKKMQEERTRVVGPFLPIWQEALSDRSGVAFGEVVAPHVRLEGSIFAAPIEGREKVWTSLRAAGGITDALSFTRESTAPTAAISNGSSRLWIGSSRESRFSASTVPDWSTTWPFTIGRSAGSSLSRLS
jgi:hypothetical protein